MSRDVALASRIVVVEPDPTDGVLAFDDDKVLDAGSPEPRAQADTGQPRSDNDHPVVFDHARLLEEIAPALHTGARPSISLY